MSTDDAAHLHRPKKLSVQKEWTKRNKQTHRTHVAIQLERQNLRIFFSFINIRRIRENCMLSRPEYVDSVWLYTLLNSLLGRFLFGTDFSFALLSPLTRSPFWVIVISVFLFFPVPLQYFCHWIAFLASPNLQNFPSSFLASSCTSLYLLFLCCTHTHRAFYFGNSSILFFIFRFLFQSPEFWNPEK